MNAETAIESIPFYNALTRQVYSPNNAKLLFEAATLAGIEDRAVAGFKQWLELGRVVKRGQHGTRIYMMVERREDPKNPESDKQRVPKGATVFFESQTAPLDNAGTETPAPLKALQHHVTGAIERGAAVAIVEQPAPHVVREVASSKGPALRKMADGMQAKIDHAFSNRLENTPKRRKQAACARLEGYHLQRTQKALYKLADLHDSGEVPPELAKVTTKAEVHKWMTTILDTSKGGYYDAPIDTGKPRYLSFEAVALWSMIEQNTEEQKHEALRRKIASVRQSGIPGFFPTPQAVINVMFERAEDNATFLENFADFSAGDGAIASEIVKRYPGTHLSLVEINPTLCEVLKAKGLAVNQADFLTIEPSMTFDCILINPPFENIADIDHVQHAYKFLRPGGVLVAVMSPGPFFRNTKKAIGFREWLEEVRGQEEDLPEGSFKESGTSISTKLVTIPRGF